MDRKVVFKEGFLVKKGKVRHNWKTRWFVLFEDALCYYKRKERKEDTIPVGEILLRGCSIVSPCPDYTKKEGVFRLITKTGREYLLQAASEGELQIWSAVIAETIRKTESKERSDQSKNTDISHESSENVQLDVHSPLPCLSDLVEAMQDQGAGISIETHRVQEKTHRLCFSGTEVIDWLISWSFTTSRIEGMQIGNSLLEQGHLQPVGLRSRNSVKRRNTGSQSAFCDGDNALYRFSALHLNNSDSFDFGSDESSDSDESDKEQQTKGIEGTVVKQGFLVKKGHVRHNWKTRKFILCRQPAKLYYSKPAKPEYPIGSIRLDGATITKAQNEGGNGEKKQKPFYGYRFNIETFNGSQLVLQAATKDELEEWVSILRDACTQ